MQQMQNVSEIIMNDARHQMNLWPPRSGAKLEWRDYRLYSNTTLLFLRIERENMQDFGLWSKSIKLHPQLKNKLQNTNT